MSERTEAPTGRRLARARGQGQVARSQELNAAAAMIVGFWLLRGPGAQLSSALHDVMQRSVSSLPSGELTGAGLRELIVEDAMRLAPGMALLLAGLLVTGVGVTVAQTGLLWAHERPAFDWSRVNPLAGLRRMASPQGLVELARALLKLLVVGWAAFAFLRGQVEAILRLGQTDPRSAVGAWAGLAYGLALRVGAAYLALAAADYAYQRWNLMRSLRMTKEEVKEDFKTSEGDPFLRGRIRQQQRRIARQRMLSRVPKADVVITNPTHLAVALQYNRETMAAPKVVAKGAVLVAERIKAIAREHGVPVVENPPVARALYRAVEVDQAVPPELYVAVAEVFAFVYGLQTPRRASPVPGRRLPAAP